MTRPPATSLPLFVTLLLWVAGYAVTADGIVPVHVQLARVAVVASVDAVADERHERGVAAAHDSVDRPESRPAPCCGSRSQSHLAARQDRWLRPPVRAPSSI